MRPGLLIRLALFGVLAIATTAAGFVLIPSSAALGIVQHFGYYLIAAAALAFALALVRLARTDRGLGIRELVDWRLLLLALAVAVLWQVHGPRGFKILMDEFVLSTAAMNMHFEREVFVPLKTHDLNGVYSTLGGVLDKRPLLFPFLLSVLHDLTGYRVGNVFLLNAVVSYALLVAAGMVGARLGRARNAGLLVVLLLGGLPLLAGNATGAGFEMLNLLLLCVVLLLAFRHLDEPGDASLDALVLGAVLLAQVRYESALFVAGAGVVLAWAWWRERRLRVSWAMVAAPVLLFAIPLQNRIFEVNKGYWQLESGMESPFGFSFLPANLGHAIEFLFVVDGYQLGSPVLSACGLVALLFFLLYALRRVRALGTEPEVGATAVFGALVLVNFLLLLCYHWGQLHDYVASRLALPLLLLFALAAGFAAGRWIRRPAVWPPVLATPLAWLLLGAVPIAASAMATETFLSFQEVRWQQEFVREHRDRRNLYILPSPLPAVLERRPAMSVEVFSERAEQMAFHLRERTYREVYVFQRFEHDPATGVVAAVDRSRLGPEFLLETIEERRFRPGFTMRASRIAGIDLALRPPRPEGWKPNFPPFEFTVPESDTTAAGAYMREFLRNLP